MNNPVYIHASETAKDKKQACINLYDLIYFNQMDSMTTSNRTQTYFFSIDAIKSNFSKVTLQYSGRHLISRLFSFVGKLRLWKM